MCLALSLLDETRAPGEIGCHLDLALDRLSKLLKTEPNLEPETLFDPVRLAEAVRPWSAAGS